MLLTKPEPLRAIRSKAKYKIVDFIFTTAEVYIGI